jgi:electron transport complex protein RnfC
MIKRSFFSLGKPGLKYLSIVDPGAGVKEVSLPAEVRLLVKDCDIGAIKLKVGTPVKTGQKVVLTDDPGCYVLSTVTGTISGVSEYAGYMNQRYGSLSIDVSGKDQLDEATLSGLEAPTFEAARDYLTSLPGKSDFSSFLKLDPPVNTVVITCVDADLLVSTHQQAVLSDVDGLIEGIAYLKKVCRVGRVMIAAPSSLVSLVSKAGVEVKELCDTYPNSLCGMIAKDVLGAGYMPTKSFEQMGIGFISAEAVISLTRIFGRAEIPVDKLITVIGKDNVPVMVKARIGTPAGVVLDAVGINASSGDRVVFGGPMTGTSIYSLDMPVLADTDAIMVQDQSQVVLSEDCQCVNCGECVRACPVKVPVNMLVRVLASGLYEDAARMYDLHACIECGLCNYVCVARIPIVHHIMLGKHEVARIKNAEGSNG